MEQVPAERQDRRQGAPLANVGRDGGKPPRDAAVQRVVVEPLVVWPGRRTFDNAGRPSQIDGVAPPPVAAAVRHIGVHVESIPAVGERLPVVERAKRFDGTAHGVGVHEDVALPHEGRLERLVRHQRGIGHTVILSARRGFRASRRC
jgi:hypothetical protein